MKIRIIGAGPAGLYFASLMKRQNPNHDIVIHERGPRGATWGFGVVFSDRALEFLRADDEEMYQYLAPHMETWPNLTIVYNDTTIPITGNGFAAIGRLHMLQLMYAYAEKLGVQVQFDSEILSLKDEKLAGADLVVGCNGAFSWVRAENEDKFGTIYDWRPNKFIWYGTTKAFDSLSLTFRETDKGVFCAHHYRFAPDMSTFLVEVEDVTWKNAGLDQMSPEDTIRYCEKVFAKDLDGHPIVSNNSYWRNFPAIWNQHWSFDNVVLMGDALRTAHDTHGSGSLLDMYYALLLAKVFKDTGDVKAALSRYQELRQPPMKKIWDAANISLRWYEDMTDKMKRMSPVEFAYSYMTRTGRVDHAEMRRRDPNLAAAFEKLHPELAAK